MSGHGCHSSCIASAQCSVHWMSYYRPSEHKRPSQTLSGGLFIERKVLKHLTFIRMILPVYLLKYQIIVLNAIMRYGVITFNFTHFLLEFQLLNIRFFFFSSICQPVKVCQRLSSRSVKTPFKLCLLDLRKTILNFRAPITL